MTSINNYLANNYYSLNSSGANSTNVNPASASTSTAANATSTATGTSAFLLDLSANAQNYLNNASVANSSSSLNGGNFSLTPQQQKGITDILNKYKDAPQTQATFNKIQDDLKAAHLDPATLSTVDKAKSFNPVQVLIAALSGNSSALSNSGMPSDSDESSKASNYMQSIAAQWKTISSTSAS